MRPSILLPLILLACIPDSAKTGDDSADTGISPDADGDGFPAVLDCDDDDAATWPGADELCDDRDNDCDGDTDEGATDGLTCYPDDDGDGYGDADAEGARSCSCDADESTNDDDCNDRARQINPAQTEVCGDGLDNDCDGEEDNVDDDGSAVAWYADGDGDGYAGEDGQGAPIYACTSPDGYVSAADGVWDCDDADAEIHPDADELCSGVGIDEDCDGLADDADPEGVSDGSTWYADADGDGFGDEGESSTSCTQPSDSVTEDDLFVDGEDCDDDDSSSWPGATETCDGVDNDCDGSADEDVQSSWYLDDDDDGYPEGDTYVLSCDADDPSTSARSYVREDMAPGWDCDDGDADIHPDASETCDGVDNNCDGRTDGVDLDALDEFDGLGDEDDETVSGTVDYYADEDLDGYAASAEAFVACEGYAPSGYYTLEEVDISDLDCDDSDSAIYPGTLETCDGADNDCDDETDEGDAADGTVFYYDADGDGYGVEFYSSDDGTKSGLIKRCTLPDGYAASKGDCDDNEASASPAGEEECGDSIDNDCDGDTDEAGDGASIWYYDGDRDGYGDGSLTTVSCDEPVGYVGNATDCDDDDDTRYPGRLEACDGDDNNCDGLESDGTDMVDEGTPLSGGVTYYYDGDSDGVGLTDGSVVRCEGEQEDNYVTTSGDCDDADDEINPNLDESCDAKDNDCDDSKDEEAVCGSDCTVDEYADHVYLYCIVEKSWSDAWSACTARDNYDFVMITTNSENDNIVGSVTPYGDVYWWIGAYDSNSDDDATDWDWTQDMDSSFSYDSWGSGEPNNAGNDEDCGQLFNDYYWNDNDCDNTEYYICESTL